MIPEQTLQHTFDKYRDNKTTGYLFKKWPGYECYENDIQRCSELYTHLDVGVFVFRQRVV